MAPCLLIFEDLDSLVTDKVRSYFLNEVDGLESNDGIMMIGSTNHLNKLDPAIAKRPSRFDRKYHFHLPAESERIAYCEYWRRRLADNASIYFPAELSPTIAKDTEGFSFAYLKELFLNALLALVGDSGTSDERNVGVDGASKRSEVNGDGKGNSEGNRFLKIIKEHVPILRAEMDDTADKPHKPKLVS